MLHGVRGGGQPKRPTQHGATVANDIRCFLGRSGLQAGDGRKRFVSSREDSSPSGTASKPQPWWQRHQQFESRCPFSAQVQQRQHNPQAVKRQSNEICPSMRVVAIDATSGGRQMAQKKSQPCKKKTHGTSPDWKSNVEAHTDPRLRTLHCAVRHMGVCEHTQLHSRHAVSIDFFRSLRPPFVHQFLGRSAMRCAKECSHTHSHIAWQRF